MIVAQAANMSFFSPMIYIYKRKLVVNHVEKPCSCLFRHTYKPDPTRQVISTSSISYPISYWNHSQFLMKIIRCRILAAVLTLVLVHLLLFSTFCPGQEQSFPRKISLSRKLLSSPFDSVSTSKLSGIKKQTKKAVEPSLRKAPSSVPNPTQNK